MGRDREGGCRARRSQEKESEHEDEKEDKGEAKNAQRGRNQKNTHDGGGDDPVNVGRLRSQ